jgi:hypothetical protein
MDGPGDRRLQCHQPFDRQLRPADCNNRSGKKRRLTCKASHLLIGSALAFRSDAPGLGSRQI